MSLLLTLLRAVAILLTTPVRHSGRPVAAAEPVVTVPATDAHLGSPGRRVPAADTSRAPPALHA
ncbi:hypothetical protein [Actinoplanes sp. DH11]|uniref:hypothetical protein n=1 Tax=Actinoplanes sp. DH11 TaxID=2857011 RepID=UPI001E2B89C9|nr:hypothetical protein [Actinoplanes sp. DH11]